MSLAAEASPPGIVARRASLPLLKLALLTAVLLRALAFAAARNTVYPDEDWQVLEPAHYLLTGHGTLPWEYLIGIRNWLFPGLVALGLEIGRLVSTAPDIRLLPVHGGMILASLVPMLCGYRWGEALGGRQSGLIVAWVAALSVDLIYIAPHTLNEVIASDVLVAALALIVPGGTVQPRWFAGGVLAGLTIVLRMQLGPALALAACLACKRDRRAWTRLVSGAALPIGAAGLLDWLTLGTPFQSIWLNFRLNVIEGVANEFGRQPAADLLIMLTGAWGGGLVPILVFMAWGGRRLPVLPLAALAILATHLAFSHKELRFVFPALPLVVIAVGLAVAELVAMVERSAVARTARPGLIAALAIMIWAGFNETLAAEPGRRPLWSRGREANDMFAELARSPDVCGIGLIDVTWPGMPGDAFLPDRIPLIEPSGDGLNADDRRFNVILAPSTTAVARDGYRRLVCHGGSQGLDGTDLLELCAWVRPGSCTRADAPNPVNWPFYFRLRSGLPDQAKITSWRFGRLPEPPPP